MISLTREHKRWSTIGQIALMVLGLGLMMSGCAGQDAIEPGRSTTPRSNVHGGAHPCGLLTRAEVQRAIGHSVLPPRRSDSDGRACDWTASDVPDSSGPRPTLVPGPATGTPYQPPVYPGVTLMLVTADWSSLRAEVGKHEGQQTAHGVTASEMKQSCLRLDRVGGSCTYVGERPQLMSSCHWMPVMARPPSSTLRSP
jgi:hypothetical protein